MANKKAINFSRCQAKAIIKKRYHTFKGDVKNLFKASSLTVRKIALHKSIGRAGNFRL